MIFSEGQVLEMGPQHVSDDVLTKSFSINYAN